MGYPIEKKLVVGVASSALFDLTESDKVFQEQGENKYREYQRENRYEILNKGVAFPFIKRLLNLNTSFPDEHPVEVVLMSRNDPDTGLRVFESIEKYGLDITRAAFMAGESPYRYIPAFNVSLFLSSNEEDVKKAIEAEYPAGIVLPSKFQDDDNMELCIAFDFDGVLASDESEKVYKEEGLDRFQESESENEDIPHVPGPLKELCAKISFFQKLERRRKYKDKSYNKLLKVAIVTARSAPSHKRVVTTLNDWGISPDETFFMGGVDKTRVLEILKPQIFFDDQVDHLTGAANHIPSVHIPFGIANKQKQEK